MYSEEQIAELKDTLKDHLTYFGYTNHPNLENDTAFFEYNDFDDNDLAMFNSFKTNNKRVLEMEGARDGPMPEYEFQTGEFIKLNVLKVPIPYRQLSYKPHEDGL